MRHHEAMGLMVTAGAGVASLALTAFNAVRNAQQEEADRRAVNFSLQTWQDLIYGVEADNAALARQNYDLRERAALQSPEIEMLKADVATLQMRLADRQGE